MNLLNPVQYKNLSERPFGLRASVFNAFVLHFAAGAAWLLFYGLKGQSDLQPFPAALGLFALSFTGIGITLSPMMLAPDLTSCQAPAPRESVVAALDGAAILMPISRSHSACA